MLETRNAKRCRKEVLLIRKFLNLDADEDVPFYDEVRTQKGDKKVSRF